MKIFKRTISLILSMAVLLASTVVYADNAKFISFKVQSIDEYGEITESDEVGYYDGENLFVSTNFITDFTLYYYDSGATSFIRKGQEKTSKYGRVEINKQNKKAVLYMNPFIKKEYTLDNIYEFSNQTFLPLAQMMSFLKASLTIKDDTMRIVNSGYSIVDADYAMSKIATKLSLVNYSINDVIDDIYAGNELAYCASAYLSYFGSTVFGLRLMNLDYITKLGDFADYESFIEKCVTNNETYIEALTTNADMINRFNSVYHLNKDVNDYSKEMKDITSLIKDVSEPLKDTSMSHALLWVDARDWNAVFDTLSSITSFADYYLKLGSMCEDNRNMINNFEAKSNADKNGLPMQLAIETVRRKYGQDLTKNIMSQIGQELVDKSVKKAKKAALETVIPSTTAITIVSKIFKAFGFDIASKGDYSILIDLNTKHSLFDDYEYLKNLLKYKDSNQTEEYRLSAVFFLQACEQTFKSANKLAKKHELSGDYYNSKIEIIDSILSLYYLAGQSKSFDNFQSVKENAVNNRNEIINGNIIGTASTVSQEEIENADNSAKVKSKSFIKKYTKAVMSFLNETEFDGVTDYGQMRIIDVNSDGYPDLTMTQHSSGGGHGGMTNVYLYNNGTFEEISIDDNVGATFFQIATDSKGKKFVSNGKPKLYNSFNDFYTPSRFGKVVVKNGKLKIKVIYDEENDFDKPKDYLKKVTSKYTFKELNDDETINFELNFDEKQEIYCQRTSSDDEVKYVINQYFKNL